MKSLIYLLIVIDVCLCVCPNNCNGNGKCVNGVCECYKKSDGSDYNYVGSDCSKRGCDSGVSFRAISNPLTYSSRKGDESNQIPDNRLLEGRSLDAVENEYKLVSLLNSSPTDASNVFLVNTDMKFTYYGNVIDFDKQIGGKLNCYDDKTVFKGYYEVIGYISDTSYYIQTSSDGSNLVGLKCEIIMVYHDLSLINPTAVVSAEKTVTWKNMANIFPYLIPSPSPATVKMLCEGTSLPVTITSITTPDKSKDLIFTLTDETANGKTCTLLTNKKLEDVKVEESDSSKYQKIAVSTVITNIVDISDATHQLVYTVPKAVVNIDKEGSIGKMSCYIPGNRTIQNAYLLGNDDTNYYIVYDFDPIDENNKKDNNGVKNVYPILYYCKLTEYVDYSLYYPVHPESDQSTILWKGVFNAINGILPTDEIKYQFACKNTTNFVTLYTYTTKKDGSASPADDIKFTISGDKPQTTDICNIIAGKHSTIVPIDITESELYKKHLTVQETTKSLKYELLPSVSTLIGSASAPYIYKVVGLDINSGSTGGIIECAKIDSGAITLFTADVLYRNGYNYYIYSDTNIESDLKNSQCKMSYSHKDLSLIKTTATSTSTVTFTGMSYYFQQLGFFNSIEKEKEYTVLCDSGIDNIYNEYKVTLTTPTTTPIYESTSGNVVFTQKDGQTLINGKDCYLLSSFDGKYISPLSSDLKQQFELEDNKNGKWEITKPTKPTLGSDSNAPIYEVTNIKYDNVTQAGGILECYSKDSNIPLGLARIYGYKKESEVDKYYIKYYFKTAAPEVTKYKCSVIDSYNDLTLYLSPLVCDGSKCESTNKALTTGVNTAIGLKINDPVDLLCGGSDNVYKIYSGKVEVGDSGTFTYTPSLNGNNCFVLSKFTGGNVDVLKSDLAKIYDITKNNDDSYKLIRKSTSLYATELKDGSDNKLGIYDLKNSKYSIGDKLFCLTNNDESYTNALVLNTNEDKTGYYIDYESGKNLFYFNCMKMKRYNDLSMYVKGIVKAGQDSNTITSKTKANAFYYMGYLQKSNPSLKFICNGVGKTADSFTPTSYKPASPNLDVVFTFTTSTVAAGENCFLMSTFTGSSLEIENSDMKVKNYIQTETTLYKYYEDEDEKPNYKEESDKIKSDKVDIIGNIGELGGNLQCKNKDDGKYLGTATLMGEDEDGNYIMKYYFDIPKNIVGYICEVNEVINDLSLIKSDEVVDDECPNKDNCIIKFNGLYEILKMNGFYGINGLSMRELIEGDDDNYNASCIDDDKVHIYKVKSEESLSGGDEAIFSLSEDDTNTKLPVGMKCSLLAKPSGEKIELEDSQIGSNLYHRENGELKTTPCDADNKTGICSADSDQTKMTISGNTLVCIKSILQKENILIIPTNTTNTTIWSNYLKNGKWIKIGSEITQIIKIDSISTDHQCTGSRRLLAESRMLADKSNGVAATISPIPKTLSSSTSFIIIQLNPDLSSTPKYDPSVIIECSDNGKCNRETGLCECFHGFTGDACQRLDCPNNCNGNGRCVPLNELLNNDDLEKYNTNFDKDKVYGCLCDKRHRGYDCSLIECPSGKDPEGATNQDKTNDEKRDCSGRGICNYNTGICECFDGFSGEGCQTQTQMM